jgi:hypothetical protein
MPVWLGNSQAEFEVVVRAFAHCVGNIAQLTAQPYANRDAVRFDNGREVLLQKFEPGQRAVVLRLALAEEVADPEIAYAGVF